MAKKMIPIYAHFNVLVANVDHCHGIFWLLKQLIHTF